jgi:excisionase family DNA binding protein
MPSQDWLELSDAANLLNVHPSTLRRWADSGKISTIKTLSGRRRFDRQAIEQARKAMIQSTTNEQVEQIETNSLAFTRQHASGLANFKDGWFSQLSQEQVMLFRYSGQRLLGLMMQFISREEGAETFFEEGKRVAADYGLICYKAGLTVSQTAEAFLYFRRSILESVQATSGLGGPNDRDGHRIFFRTSDFYDAMLVATIDSYSRLQASSSQRGT